MLVLRIQSRAFLFQRRNHMHLCAMCIRCAFVDLMLLVLLFTDYPGRLCNPLVCLHWRALHYNCHDSREMDANIVLNPKAEEKLVVPMVFCVHRK